MKFIGGKDNGGGGIHRPSGQWMTVSAARLSILPDGQEDLDEATEKFRRVAKLEPVLYISQPCV